MPAGYGEKQWGDFVLAIERRRKWKKGTSVAGRGRKDEGLGGVADWKRQKAK